MQNECDSMSIEFEITHTIIVIKQKKNEDCKETLLRIIRNMKKMKAELVKQA